MVLFKDQKIIKKYKNPIELLIDLINNQEVNIYYVSISDITNQYIQFIKSLKYIDLEKASQFILTASTLLELKSMSLLPQEEELFEDEDTQEMLEKKLKEYRKYKRISKFLKNVLDVESKCYLSFIKLDENLNQISSEFIGDINIYDLAKTWYEFSIPQIETEKVDTSFIRNIRMNIDEEINRILDVLEKSPHISFHKITSHFRDRIKIIVSFLAILELYKQGEIELLQKETFGTIRIFKRGYLS
jgi:segregation and condensation protein A